MPFFGLLNMPAQAILYFLEQRSLWLWLRSSDSWTTWLVHALKKKKIKAAVWQSILNDFLIFQQAVGELHQFNSMVSHSPKYLYSLTGFPFSVLSLPQPPAYLTFKGSTTGLCFLVG